MRILMVAIGSDGDVNPVLEIAKELKSRGHDIHFFANEHFKKKVDNAGFNYIELGSEELYQQTVKNPDLWHPQKGFSAVWNSMKEYLEFQYELIEERLIPGETALVGTSLAVATRIAREKFPVKLTSIHLQPSLILSSHKPPYMPGLSLPEWFPLSLNKAIMGLIDEHVLDKVVKDDINHIRSKLGLSPVKSIMTKWIHSPDQVLLTFPDWYAEPQPDWPANCVFSGFPVFPSQQGEKVSDAVENFIDKNGAPIVFTAGSAMAHSKKFFQTAIETTNKLETRAVFVSKFKDQIPDDMPDYVIHSSYEPFDLLFPQAAAIVHHGGIGTSAQCLKGASPQMIVPFAHDQFDNADRLEKLGVGAHCKSISVKEWTKHLSKLINEPKLKENCIEKSKLMDTNETACQKAANFIEELGC